MLLPFISEQNLLRMAQDENKAIPQQIQHNNSNHNGKGTFYLY